MRTRMIVLTVAFCLCGVLASIAQDMNLGTWTLNETKSKIPPGAGKNTNVVYTTEGDSYKGVVEGTDGKGNPTHSEWTGKFDGKDYPVTGDPNVDSRSIQKIDERHYNVTNKKGGKATATGTIEFSEDGQTRTVTINSTDAKGQKVTSSFVFEKG